MQLITLEGLNGGNIKTPKFIDKKNDKILTVAKDEVTKALKDLDTADYLTIVGEVLQSKWDYAKTVFQPAIDKTVQIATAEYKPVAYGTLAAVFGVGLIVGILIHKYMVR